jgi:hypothetical protein
MDRDAVNHEVTVPDGYVPPTCVRLGSLSELTLGAFAGFEDAHAGDPFDPSIVF